MILWALKNSKSLMIGGAVIGITALLLLVRSHFINEGYNRAISDIQSKTNEQLKLATERAISNAEKEIKKRLDTQKFIFDSELQRVINEKTVETKIKKVIEYVDKIEIKTECTNLTDDVIGLLNQAVNTANSASN